MALPAGAGRGREFCAAVCRALAEPLIGTAPPAAVGWLLVEHSGPWPAFGLPDDLPAELKAYAERALEFGVRTQLIRRPGRPDRAVQPDGGEGEQSAIRVMIAGGPPVRRWLEAMMLSPEGLARSEHPRGSSSGSRSTRAGSCDAEAVDRIAASSGSFGTSDSSGSSGPGGSACSTLRNPAESTNGVGGLSALIRMDADAFRSPDAPGIGAPVGAALLVCTHGRREVCCAKYGRPVAAALDAAFGSIAWETTHIGGDRFAAGLVALPSGAYFGRLDPAEAVRAARGVLDGELDLEHYRGTAGTPTAVQAAECFLRREFGLTRSGAIRHVGGRGLVARFSVDASDGVSGATPLGAAPVFEVELTRRPAGCPRLTSCGSGTVEEPPAFRLRSITAVP